MDLDSFVDKQIVNNKFMANDGVSLSTVNDIDGFANSGQYVESGAVSKKFKVDVLKYNKNDKYLAEKYAKDSNYNDDDKKRDDVKSAKKDKYSDDTKVAKEDKYDDDVKSAKEDKYGDDTKSAKEDKYDDDAKLAKEDKYDDDAKSAKEDKYGDDDKLAKKDKYDDDDKLAKEDKYGDDAKSAKEDKYGDDEKLAKEDKYHKDDKGYKDLVNIDFDDLKYSVSQDPKDLDINMSGSGEINNLAFSSPGALGTTEVPEPATIALFSIALLFFIRRKHARDEPAVQQ